MNRKCAAREAERIAYIKKHPNELKQHYKDVFKASGETVRRLKIKAGHPFGIRQFTKTFDECIDALNQISARSMSYRKLAAKWGYSYHTVRLHLGRAEAKARATRLRSRLLDAGLDTGFDELPLSLQLLRRPMAQWGSLATV